MPNDPAAPIAPSVIAELRAEARYHRERYGLYKAKAYGGRPTSGARLRELERADQGADARLRRALRQNASAPAPPTASC
ncbi:MAG TPA: hypothetical protein VGX69_11310 [Solirubrobacteraceae bacterium]|jgi:hypothetical protein|nr:hypothetical protein [Solirubrobacteraceae bacterium]